jgi:hypothetical protein
MSARKYFKNVFFLSLYFLLLVFYCLIELNLFNNVKLEGKNKEIEKHIVYVFATDVRKEGSIL